MTLVEPSAAMLESTLAALRGRGITHEAANVTLQQFVRDDAAACWDLAQATFSLHNIPPAERAPLFVWLRRKVGRLLIAEFDVPVFADMYSPEHVTYVVDRYEKGLLEYAGDGGLVAQGFLMPVFFGNFDRSAARTTYEQPIETWENELRAAGFGRVERRDLDDYWWARAHLVDAR
ncbi:MAG: hypothetical protein IPM54_12040 [Polyangiaceae bacterium]|nr:hypothetical protein [Polyangiaceae bacterium]